ncbi:hypothetical protein OH77DRAFT_1525920 [Trametes cingulata]|nr:hypothetical protein OH77DRAFT_1525920 [Trametes cingulata]
MARALVATSFILSNESRASKYKSGVTRQDPATLPRGEHPLINSPYMREQCASSGEPGSARSSSVPPVPRLPTSGDKSQRNSVVVVLDSGEKEQLVPPPQLKRPKSTGRLRREQTISMPPISPISEVSSPAPSVPETPGAIGLSTSNVFNSSNCSLANPLAQQRALTLSDSNASSSSLDTEASSHARAATEPGGMSTAADRRPSNASKPKDSLVAGFDRSGAAMPGTMRSSGAGRPDQTRRAPPRGGCPASVLVSPSPQPSVASNIGAPTPTSSRVGASNLSDTPVDSPDLLDNFPLQIARERSAGPPPPLPLGRRSEESSAIPTPLQSSSGESMSGRSINRQTFPETPNAFSPLWSGTFASPPEGPRSSLDQSIGRNGSNMRAGPHQRANGSHPDSPVVTDPPVSQAIKRLTAIEEQVASRSVSQYSTIPELPTTAQARRLKRLLINVTNPDEPLASPPPSYPATFDPPPPQQRFCTPRSGTADSSENSFPSSLHSSSMHLQASSSQSSRARFPKSARFPFSVAPTLVIAASSVSWSLKNGCTLVFHQRGAAPHLRAWRWPALRCQDLLHMLKHPGAPSTPLRAAFTPDSTRLDSHEATKRPARTQPPLPQGPRAPSYGSATARMRAGSVSSLNNGGGSEASFES